MSWMLKGLFRKSDENSEHLKTDPKSGSISDHAPAVPETNDQEPITTISSNEPIYTEKDKSMSSTDISGAQEIAGFIGACLVDTETGLMMASEGGGADFDLETAGAANVEVVKAKMSAMKLLDLDEKIDDILITLGSQFHLIRPLVNTPTVFIYLALDKKAANLGMARVQLKKVEKQLEI